MSWLAPVVSALRGTLPVLAMLVLAVLLPATSHACDHPVPSVAGLVDAEAAGSVDRPMAGDSGLPHDAARDAGCCCALSHTSLPAQVATTVHAVRTGLAGYRDPMIVRHEDAVQERLPDPPRLDT